MTEQTPQSYIHYDPERVDYSLTEQELQNLASAGHNNWKDFCISCFALGVPCAINAIVEFSKQETFSSTLSFNINVIIAVVGLFLAVAFAVLWRNSRVTVKSLLDKIKNKPKMPITASFLNVGPLNQQDDTGV
jgi:hypothetical protein